MSNDDRTRVIELRQYQLRPGARDTLIELFDSQFIESQEACGMRVIGQFRDLDDPDRFVWLRGFASMEERAAGLTAFYGGPVWTEHGPAANATMVSSDDVHMLRPLAEPPTFQASDRTQRLLLAAILPCAPDGEIVGEIAAACSGAEGDVLALLGKEDAPNNWPRLSVHDRLVWVLIARFASEWALDRGVAAVAAAAALHADILDGPPELRRLAPTARSRL
ncbi:NIPSNAP family protein [Nitratireductor mangrovi]|uniref:NIPSNAP family protein n=1 Tax=Nitratireductor mangrovi TaxID=2599600 RepID=A0A5B8L2J1_9HYPH|nr:NIPSNAP family protein [Nitratireductor mangrovi]QDZ02019.1 NIPSNAP family protein [Nitratireductor mangrovi]